MSGPNPPGPESEELEPGVEPSEGDTEFEHGGSEFGQGSAGDGPTRTARRARPISIPGPTRLRSPNTSAAAHMCPPTWTSTTTTATTTQADEEADATAALAVDRRHCRDRRGGRPGGVGVAAVRPHRHQQAGDAQHRAHVDAADAGRDHRHHTAARAASAADQRGAATASAADQRGAATATSAATEAPPPPAPAPAPAPRRRRPPHRRRPRHSAAPRQVTYSVTGTKAPFDQITITYTDASGMRRILPNVYIPWTITLTPISQSDVGSIEASSLLRLSRLNCSITTSDGTVLSSNENNQPQANC